jgi:hypothetical protein
MTGQVSLSGSWIAGPVYVMGSSYEVPFSRTRLSEARVGVYSLNTVLLRSYFSL